MKQVGIVSSEVDNVATALRNLNAGQKIEIGWPSGIRKDVLIKENIPLGHKFALRDFLKGEHVIKYGEVIGETIETILEGCHVHSHNLKGLRG